MDYKPLSGREYPRFSAIKTFFRLPQVPTTEIYDVAIVGVPFDGGVTYRPGARFAPARVRELSSLGRGYHWSRALAVFDRLKVADAGDCPTVPIDLKQTYSKIEEHFGQILRAEKRFLAVGGDHSITLPLLRACRRKAQQKLSFVHFDAHFDTYPAAWDCEYHHGSFVRHAVEEGLIDPTTSVQIGIRGPLAGGDDLEFVKKHGLRTITVDEVRRQPLADFLKTLPQFVHQPVYLSFDVDCLDPAYAPGTGTPVVGGLTTYETQTILRALKINHLFAADVVEVSPPYDQGDITSLAAVDAMFECLCLMASKAS
ncbi:MAG: agmatinase [Bdellovibrionales bacterium]|nr:agmatinase [Bdellovibrionales bacterium]